MSVPGLCMKYGSERMAKIGALTPAFLNAALFFSQASNSHPLVTGLSTIYGFFMGGIVGMASFSATMKAHDKMDELLSGRSMSMTRKVKLVRRGQVAVFSLAAASMIGGMNAFGYALRQDQLLYNVPPTTTKIAHKNP